MRKAVFASVIGIYTAAPLALAAEEVVIAALGDSLTQGFGLVQEDGFVPQLQAWLDRQGLDVRLINAGQSGDTTAGGLSRVAWTLTPEVDAVIVTLGGNDFLRGIDPAVSRGNIEGILQVAQQSDVEVLLVGMHAPGNFGPDYKQEFDAIYPELSDAYETVYAEDFFGGFEVNGDASAARAFMQADGIHPNALGVARIVEALGPKVIELASRVGPKAD